MNIGDNAEKALRIAREDPLIAFDTESSGLDWTKNQPVGYVITSSMTKESFYVPIRHGGGGNLMCHVDRRACEPMLRADDPIIPHSFEVNLRKAFEERQRRGMYTVGHNVKFDAHMAANAGILLGRNLYDTGITQALLNEYTRSWSLDDLAKEWRVTAKLAQSMYDHLANTFGGDNTKKQMENFWRTAGTDAMVHEYAAGDGVTTLELHTEQIIEIAKQELNYIHRIESQLIWTLFRMERRGIRVDLEYCKSFEEEIAEKIRETEAKLPEGFNSRSPTDMRNLMTSIGRTDWPLTEKGNPSFTEHWLKTFEEGRAILENRQWHNIRNTFLKPLVEEHAYQGRVHPNINQLKGDEFGTISGRLSCSRPNLQQIPKRNKNVAKPFRKVFIADEGFVFHERDYSQCEPRLFAHYSKEPSLVEGYKANPPRDMHAVVAELLKVERDPTAKRMNMGILTGMFPKAFAGHMGWTVDEATYYWNMWFDAFPGIRDFQGKASAVFRSRGYVKTLLGRRCRLDKPRFAYRGTSRIIQGGNADILKAKMLEIDLYFESLGDTSHLLMSVHDSMVYQTPEGPGGEKAHEEVGRIMEDVQMPPFNLIIPFKTDSGSGKNWSEASFG